MVRRANSGFSVNEDVIIRLKWGQTEYKGRLISVDSYMNIQLSDTEEFIDRKNSGTLGQVLIRYAKFRHIKRARLIYATDVTTSSGFRPPKVST